MDRLNQLRGEAGTSRDCTLDTSSPPGEAFITANESTSKYFSLSEDDSTFDISPIKQSHTLSSVDTEKTITEPDRLISNLSPIGKKNDFLDSYKIGKQIEAANILSGGVDIFDDNDNSYDGDELVIDDNACTEDKGNTELQITEAELKDDNSTEATLVESEPVPSKDTEVILQIDGKNVDAIDIGNGLYLYRKEGEEELAAVQIDEDKQQPSFKFLKVRENAEGNLEVYEEIPIEVPKELPAKEGKAQEKNISHVPIKDINKVISDTSTKNVEKVNKTLKEPLTTVVNDLHNESNKDHADSKMEVNGKLMKFGESRKSPVVGSFTPMAYHSTPNKERIPLTKTMVDLQLHPNRHSDNVKKTIEVHTDNLKHKIESQRHLFKDSVEDKSKNIVENETHVGEKCLLIEDVIKAPAIESIEKKGIKGEPIEAQSTGDTKIENRAITVSPIENKDHQESNTDNFQCTTENKYIRNLPSTDNKDNNINLVQNSKTSEIEKLAKEPAIENLNTFMENEVQNTMKQQHQDDKSEDNEIKTESIEIEKSEEKNVSDNNNEKRSTNDDVNPDNNLYNPKYKINVDKKVCVVDENSSNKICNLSIPLPSSSDISSNSIDRKESTIECVINKDNLTASNTSVKTNVKENENHKTLEDKINLVNKDMLIQKIPQLKKKNQESEILPALKNIIPDTQSNEAKGINIAQGVDKEEEKHVEQIKSCNNMTAERGTSKNSNFLTKLSLEKTDTASHQVTEDSSNKNLSKNIIISKKDTVKEPSAKRFNAANKDSSIRIEKLNVDPIKKETAEKDTNEKEIISAESVETTHKITAGKVDNAKKEISLTIMKDETTSNEKIEIETKVQSVSIENKDTNNKEMISVSLQDVAQNKDNLTDKKVTPIVIADIDVKSISTNHAPVPFGKWTEANRQAFLDKIKETKVHSNSSNGKQIKNSNDLNRRDFLKKIDTQRQFLKKNDSQKQTSSNTSTSKVQNFGSSNRLGIKKEASVFSNKPITQESKLPVKTEASLSKSNAIAMKKVLKQESIIKTQKNTASLPNTDISTPAKKEPSQRKEINNQDLIDKTIEEIINRATPSKSQEDNVKETITAIQNKETENTKTEQPVGLDEIEMKMNELHGIPFIERPAHELPHVNNPVVKTYTKSESQKVSTSRQSKIPNLIPFTNKSEQTGINENIIDIDSEEEIIEHEPITGDMEAVKKNISSPPISEKSSTLTQIPSDISKKEAIITEKDFDKFVRRNSINYENCITVNFDTTEYPNVVNTVVPKDTSVKTYSKFEKYDKKLVSPTMEHSTVTKTVQNIKKNDIALSEDNCNKNYQSKVKMAYKTAMTAKCQMERPITIIEDKPVKVVFMDSNAEFIPRQLNAQGKELSPAKKQVFNLDLVTTDSLDSDILEIDDGKSLEDNKNKTKHQRKQVLTPVDTPDLELIEPNDLGIEVSPKKKRKIEEKVTERSPKPLVPKKTYLLGRATTKDEAFLKSYELPKVLNKESQDRENNFPQKNTASAIDNLVKAAELLETQSANIICKTSTEVTKSDILQNTPVKRGRGRPRKYPLPQETTVEKTKVPSPQKKPRLSDAKMHKTVNTDDEDSIDGEMVKENWTMGKINENIVCPICDKLFRSENVVFKHVKHCTGPSPNRSESGNKSPRRLRESQDSDKGFGSMHVDDFESYQTIEEKRKTRMSRDKNPKSINERNEIIVIEDTPIKLKPEKCEEPKYIESKKSFINKSTVNNLICEFCGKTFRQLSYLINHKVLHEKEDVKKVETDVQSSKAVFSCEVCKKEFRKLHHLVQHRIIHNLNSGISSKRKSSSEQIQSKISKDNASTRQNDEASTGFRCEPCDKSFRKLHHLVEHRETHDGINRQKSTSSVQTSVEKLPPPPQCDICKKTFRKLHHLIEHKEQHLETSSEKSDDKSIKSIKSSLSTKDIIHECSLCYMVFPNEHSLNKHTVICQRKKRQSSSKQTQQVEQIDVNEEHIAVKTMEDDIDKDEVIIVSSEMKQNETVVSLITEIKKQNEHINGNIVNTIESALDLSTESPNANHIDTVKNTDLEIKANKIVVDKNKDSNKLSNNSEPIKILDAMEGYKILDTPKEHIKLKKTPLKDKIAPTVTKRHKPNLPIIVASNTTDDDEVRYMLNPDFKIDTAEGKMFMKVRAKKRNSLQIERPDSKDLVKRRISLQHPPKIPRLKPKAVSNKTITNNSSILTKKFIKPLKPEPVPSTDSDDSDTKYSFPKDVLNKMCKTIVEEPLSKDQEKKKPRKSLAEKRKSLGAIAKKKSLGKTISPKQKIQPFAVKLIKKRITEVEHRCDCGQLFSSGALLSRHTTLAHTPPRIRRRRSPLPENSKMVTKPRQISTLAKAKQGESQKFGGKTEVAAVNTTRKSSLQKNDVNSPEIRKSSKSIDKVDAAKNITLKDRRSTAHKGPEKMKKVIEKSKK